MRISDLINEAPLADYQPLGDFSKPGQFRGADKKLVPHPVNKLKTATFFEQTPYDFRIFFSHLSGTKNFAQEFGAADQEKVEYTFAKYPGVAEQILQGHENAITIVFMGNSGDDKVMLTPWVMAHRLGHAIQATVSKGDRPRSYPGTPSMTGWKEADKYWYAKTTELLRDVYSLGGESPSYGNFGRGFNLTAHASALFNAIGTQRSSRENKIKRPYEFMYEMFAQYLKTGAVKLNPLPRIWGYGHQAWGNHTQHLKAKPEISDQDLADMSDMFANDMSIMFSSALAECEGKIFLM